MLPNNGSIKKAKCEDLENVVFGNDLEKFFQIDSQLPTQERKELTEFLRKNVDVFAWISYEALGWTQTSFTTILMSIHLLPKKKKKTSSALI